MEKHLKNQIENSKLRQQLMELGLRSKIEDAADSIPLNYINNGIQLIEEEKQSQQKYERLLQDFYAGVTQKREKAKSKLGIKSGDN